MNDSSLEMQLNDLLICMEPCSEEDYLLALLFVYLLVGYFIWAWNHE